MKVHMSGDGIQLSPEQGGTENFVLNKQVLTEVMLCAFARRYAG